jgi:GT2 family glycosyltransferase
MRETGLAAVKYGVECGSRELLKASGKGLNLEKAIGNILLTQEMGIKTHLTFMFGLPGETRETAEQTIELALRLAPESLQFTIATPFPGSEYHHVLEERGLLVHHSAEHYDGFRTAAVHTGHLGPEELEDILKEANRRWRGIWVSQRKVRGEYPVDVSVVIPNFHQREALLRCLRALGGQTYDRFEVIVVDNGSRDDSVPAARQEMPDVTVIEREQALGFAAAVNLGIEAANGRYIAVLNNDAEPDREWLESLLAVFESTPDVGFLASAVLRRDEPDIVDSMGEGLSSGCFPFQVANGVAAEVGKREPLEVLGAPATAAIYRRELLEDVGGFDEDFETYLEDLDLSLRAQLAGWRCLVVPEARVLHRGQLSTGGMRNGEVVRLIGRNWVQLVLKSIPRSLLRQNALRIVGVGFRQLAWHTIRSRHPLSFIRGVAQGLWRWRRLVAQRQTILGWRRVDDARVAALMALGDEQLRRTRGQRERRSGDA